MLTVIGKHIVDRLGTQNPGVNMKGLRLDVFDQVCNHHWSFALGYQIIKQRKAQGRLAARLIDTIAFIESLVKGILNLTGKGIILFSIRRLAENLGCASRNQGIDIIIGS